MVDAQVTFSLARAAVANHDVPERRVEELTGRPFRVDGGVEAVFEQPQSEVQAADAAAPTMPIRFMAINPPGTREISIDIGRRRSCKETVMIGVEQLFVLINFH